MKKNPSPVHYGIALLAAMIAAPVAQSAVLAYGIDGIGELRQIDLLTMQSTVLGSTGRAGPFNVGLAIDPNDQLYLADGSGGIFSLALNGTTTLIGNPLQGAITGLDWDPMNNNLLVVTAGLTFFHADPLTGAALNVPIAIPISGAVIDSIAYVTPTVGLITYAIAGVSKVSLLSLTNGSLLGTPATAVLPDYWTGVDIDPATNIPYMIGFDDDSWQITNNAGTLTDTHIATNGHLDWTALAIPIPEPGSAVLLLGGAGVLTLSRRRRVRVADATSPFPRPPVLT